MGNEGHRSGGVQGNVWIADYRFVDGGAGGAELPDDEGDSRGTDLTARTDSIQLQIQLQFEVEIEFVVRRDRPSAKKNGGRILSGPPLLFNEAARIIEAT